MPKTSWEPLAVPVYFKFREHYYYQAARKAADSRTLAEVNRRTDCDACLFITLRQMNDELFGRPGQGDRL